MLQPKEAFKKSLEYLVDAFPQATDLSLESLVISNDKKEWSTTVSFIKEAPKQGATTLDLLLSSQPKKEFRTIKITAEDGEFMAIESPNVK